LKASDFSSSGSDWARQILQLPQSSWPTNTSIGRPASACALCIDDAAAASRPVVIKDRLFSMGIFSSWNELHSINMAIWSGLRKRPSPVRDMQISTKIYASVRDPDAWVSRFLSAGALIPKRIPRCVLDDIVLLASFLS
jgi:hypothetical protein